jgi:hypothetical protein
MRMKFVFLDHELKKCWIVEAEDRHRAISLAVENDYTESMSDFYYGLEDGQISIYEVTKEVTT